MNNKLDLLIKQTQDAYRWADKLLAHIPEGQWDTVPPGLETSVTWQAGHLIISYYFHSIMVTVGHQPDVFQLMPLKQYSELFTQAPAQEATGKTVPAVLKEHLTLMQERSLQIIAGLSDQLDSPLYPGPIKHPIAQTKGEAIDWNIKHTMWHCGQLGMLARALGKRYDFGLSV